MIDREIMTTSRLRLHRGDGVWWIQVNRLSPMFRDSNQGWIRLATPVEIDNFQCAYLAERSMTPDEREAREIERDRTRWDSEITQGAAVVAAGAGVVSSDPTQSNQDGRT